MSSPIEPRFPGSGGPHRGPETGPQRLENGPTAPAGAARSGTLFDKVFLGGGGVRAGWRAGVYASLFLVLMSAAQLVIGTMGLASRIDPREHDLLAELGAQAFDFDDRPLRHRHHPIAE